jgi:mannose-6-phosphate isomerase-like protein (cupin superfamily)
VAISAAVVLPFLRGEGHRWVAASARQEKDRMAEDRAAPFLLGPDESRVDAAMLPFKVTAADSAGAASVCEFRLDAWGSGPVLHAHHAVDEGFFVVTGLLEVALGDERHQAMAGSFIWVPRGTAHTFANAGEEPVHVLALAMPGGIEHMFAEQAAHLTASNGESSIAALDEIARRHGAVTLGPPIRAHSAPPL